MCYLHVLCYVIGYKQVLFLFDPKSWIFEGTPDFFPIKETNCLAINGESKWVITNYQWFVPEGSDVLAINSESKWVIMITNYQWLCMWAVVIEIVTLSN